MSSDFMYAGGFFCYNGPMTKLCLSIALLALAAPLLAADLPGQASVPVPAAPGLFDPDRFVTTGGVRYLASPRLTLEPELGVGYRGVAREFAGGLEESTHRLHAQAGGRLSLAETLYLSAAAKLPVYTFEKTGGWGGQDLAIRQGYDFAHPLRAPLTFTGEFGLHLSTRTDLQLYYDQSSASGWWSGGPQQEERIGTRIIWRFK